MKENLYIISLIVFSFFITACINTIPQPKIFITTPSNNWVYYDDSLITFSTNVNSNEIVWSSNKDGFIGKGATISSYLSYGEHEIKAELGDFYDTVFVYIRERKVMSGQTILFLLNKLNKLIHIEKGMYNPCLISLEQSIDMTTWDKNNCVELKKDFLIPRVLRPKKINLEYNRAISGKQSNVNDTKFFYVINTKSQSLQSHFIECKIIRDTDRYTVWYPVDERDYSFELLDFDYLNKWLVIIEDIILPRFHMIWGDIPDIDGDKKISFLISPTINEEETAIGFFNSNDFFKNDDTNMYSNEMDIIYLAVPQRNSFAYSAECIAATVAHELTHLITFYNKSYSKYLLEGKEIIQEEVFLDEAISHLTESLCGFSVTGGNISNLSLYLDNTDVYSFCSNDIYGQSDSNGQRGAATLFLSWIFWKTGGISWDNQDPIKINDNGGIIFLRKLIEQEEIGWQNLGKAYGKSTDSLFLEMIEEINAFRSQSFNPVIDPFTGEPVQLFINIGSYSIEELNRTWEIKGPVIKKYKDINRIPSYSYILLEEYKSNGSYITVNNTNKNNRLFVAFYKQ